MGERSNRQKRIGGGHAYTGGVRSEQAAGADAGEGEEVPREAVGNAGGNRMLAGCAKLCHGTGEKQNGTEVVKSPVFSRVYGNVRNWIWHKDGTDAQNSFGKKRKRTEDFAVYRKIK